MRLYESILKAQMTFWGLAGNYCNYVRERLKKFVSCNAFNWNLMTNNRPLGRWFNKRFKSFIIFRKIPIFSRNISNPSVTTGDVGEERKTNIWTFPKTKPSALVWIVFLNENLLIIGDEWEEDRNACSGASVHINRMKH